MLRRIRPEYVGIDPVDRVVYQPGEVTQCDLWFPETAVPVDARQVRILPVLVVTLAFSRFLSATMIPSRQAGDILSGMWLLISQLGRVPKTLVWDRESAIGGTGRVSVAAAAFAGTLATRIRLAPPRAVGPRRSTSERRPTAPSETSASTPSPRARPGGA